MMQSQSQPMMQPQSQPMMQQSQPMMQPQSQPMMQQSQPMMQPQTQPMMQPQQVVYIQTVPVSGSRIRQNFASKAATALAAVQLAIGILCVLLNSIAIGVASQFSMNPVGAGIWCGILFIIAGALGLGAARAKTNCMIISFMVMSIISAVFTVSIFTVSGIEVSTASRHRYSHYYYRGSKASVGINATMLILTLVELVIAIVASALCCNALCGCCVTPTYGGPQCQQTVQYGNQPGAVAYVQGGAPGVSYYSPQPMGYAMQPNTVMVSQAQQLPAGQGQHPTAPGTATLARTGETTPPPAYTEDIPEKK